MGDSDDFAARGGEMSRTAQGGASQHMGGCTRKQSCAALYLEWIHPLSARAWRYSHPRSPNAERSTPGGAYQPPDR
jgi:hypothetical protein